jgi:hypothetical protein
MESAVKQVLLVGFAVLAVASFARASVVTVGAAKDAMIFGTSGDIDTGNASGKGPVLAAGADGSSNKNRALILYDVASAVPAGATITDVTMTLSLAQVAGSKASTYLSRTFRLFDLRQAWGEGNSGLPTSSNLTGVGQGYPRQTGDSTWDYAFYDANASAGGKWNAGSADLHGGNFAAIESGVATFTTFTVDTPYSWSSPAMVGDVQNWLDGALPNNGWLIKSDLETSPTSFLSFWSKEGAAVNTDPGSEPPALTITYTAPEPASAGLLLFGIMLTLRRRTRW